MFSKNSSLISRSLPTLIKFLYSLLQAFIVESGSCGYASDPGACDRLNTGSSNVGGGTCNDSSPSPYGDELVCGTYYICSNGNYQKQECPTGKYFSTPDNACKDRQTAVTTKGCNRCQYATTNFVNAADPSDCASYYYCYDTGKAGTPISCNTGYYFNEADQVCASDATLKEYAEKNGACINGGTATTESPDSTTEASTTTTTKNPETS